MFVGARNGGEAGDAARVDRGNPAINLEAETGLARRERCPRGEAGGGDRVGGVAGEKHREREGGAPPRGGEPTRETGEERGERAPASSHGTGARAATLPVARPASRGEDEPEQGRAMSEAATGQGGEVTAVANRR